MDINSIFAKDVMSRELVRVHPETKLIDLVKLLQEKHISGVPVVDKTEKFVGVVSTTDILRLYAIYYVLEKEYAQFPKSAPDKSPSEKKSTPSKEVEYLGQKTVGDIMSRSGSFTFREDSKVVEIAKIMDAKHIHRVFITDDQMNLKGVVSASDFAKLIVRCACEKT